MVTCIYGIYCCGAQEPAAQSPKISKQDISQAAALSTNEEVEKPDQEVPTEEPDSLNEPAQVQVPLKKSKLPGFG